MAAVFAQMWVLCLVAFLLGALVTWLAIGRSGPPRRSSPLPVEAVPLDPVQAAQARPTPIPGVPRHARGATPVTQVPPSPTPPATPPPPGSPEASRRSSAGSAAPRHPALADLDNLRRRPRPGGALGAVDRRKHSTADSDPRIPRQQGPGPRGTDLFTPPEPRTPPAGDQDGPRG